MFVLICEEKGVDGSVRRRMFEVPRQETFNLARLGVLNQFLSQSETDGSIGNGNYVDLSDLRSVDAGLTMIKLRHCRERYDRLVRGFLSIDRDADAKQRSRQRLEHASVQRLVYRSCHLVFRRFVPL